MKFSPLNQSIITINQSRSLPHNQRGAALIVVLLMLILVALAGAIAVKQSSNDLKTATADQINTLLLQSADGANGSLESAVNGDIEDQAYKDLLGGGMVWFFITDKRASGSEYKYCYNMDSNKYRLTNATVVAKGIGDLYTNGGVCDHTKPEGYINERQTSLVQVNVTTTPVSEDDEALKHYTEGKGIGGNDARKAVLDVYSTSMIPSYAEPTGCIDRSALDTGTVTTKGGDLLDCVRNKNTPTKMLFQNIEIENASTGTICKKFGKGSLEQKCIIKSSGS